MNNIYTEIIDWVRTKPVFWQFAVYKLIMQNEIKDDIEDLVKICKVEANLIEEELPDIDFSDLENSLSLSKKKIMISKIKNVKNIKALKEGEKLNFKDEGLTVIYGDNGSGKSSYTGILKHICKTRGDLPTLSKNLYKTSNSNSVQSAEVEYIVDDIDTKIVKLENNKIDKLDLKVIDVFDTNSANHYIEEEDEIAFLPSGVAILEKLAKCCQEVEKKINRELETLNNKKYDYSYLLEPETEVSSFLRNIDEYTSLDQLQEISEFNIEDEKKLKDLQEKLVELKKLDPEKRINENKKVIERFKVLKKYYEDIEEFFLDRNIEEIIKYIEEKNKLLKTRDEITNKDFSDLPINGIGNTTWKHLWESARKFICEIRGENIFPEVDNNPVCPLCLQKLDEDAKKRFLNFESFIKKDIQKNINEKENKLNEILKKFNKLNINFEAYNLTLKEIYELDDKFEKVHSDFEKNIKDYKTNILSAISTNKSSVIKNVCIGNEVSTKINEYIQNINDKNEELKKMKISEEINIVQKKINKLIAHRKIKDKKAQIVSEISRIKKVKLTKEAISKCNTRNITTFSNKISTKYVTKSIQDSFKKELKKLSFKNIDIVPETRGKRGKQYFYLKLKENYNTSISLKDILSEGEHRAISLATFFSELSIAEQNYPIIFDDPVSSLDHKWRNKIAKRIIEESLNRQIIIFTHDITFLMMLQEHSTKPNVKITLKSLTRKPYEAGIVAKNPPWDAINVKKRIGVLKDEMQKLDKAFEKETDEETKDKVKNFYGKLRETWERVIEEILLNNTVTRFGRTIQTQRLKKVIDLTEKDYEIIDKNMFKASTCFTGHDTAGALNEETPDIDEIKKDLNLLEEYVKELRKRR